MSVNTTCYSCANRKYEDYIPLFVSSTLHHNSDIAVEIGVDNEDIIRSEPIKFLKSMYGDRLHIHVVNFGPIHINGKLTNLAPGIVRFITTPEIKNENIYICDIDMLNLESNIVNINLAKMIINKTTYNNFARKSDRLTGLHFTKWDNYYPIGNFSELYDLSNLLGHDESFLYSWVERKGNKISRDVWFIPQHGIHMCPNHPIQVSKRWIKEWRLYSSSNEFLTIKDHFSDRLQSLIKIVQKELL